MEPETQAPASEPVAPVAAQKPVTVPPLDRNIPLSQQTDKILRALENMPERKEAPKDGDGEETPKPKETEAPKETPAEKPLENIVDATAEALFDDDYEEEREVTPFEVKTWQEYVSSNVQPITVIGKVGDEIKEFKVFEEGGLPADFEFRSDVDRMKYTRAFDRLERKAESLQQEFYQKQQQESIRQFEIQEAKDVASDLKWLQSRGLVPKFQFEDTDPQFNSDPAVKEANAIYDLYKKTNNEYAQRYLGTGRSYRISFRDAADKYYATKARTAPKESPKEAPKEKTPIEKQRDNIGGRIGAPQGGEAQTVKPKAFKGMSFSDINRLVRANKI